MSLNYRVLVRVFDEGHGDPKVGLDHGFTWWAPMEKEAEKGTFNNNSLGMPGLQYIEGLGLTMRAFVNYWDTLLLSWSFSVGAAQWEQWRSADGAYVQRLFQRNSLGTASLGSSTFTHPPNPNFAITLRAGLPPSDWDFGQKPYFRFTFGGGQYAIFCAEGGSHLQKWNGTQFVSIKELGELSYASPMGESEEAEIIVRCEDGAIAVSVDSGADYKVYRPADGTAVTVPSGKMGIETRGGTILFGLHPLGFDTSAWVSPIRNAGMARALVSSQFSDWSTKPNGSNITYTDLSNTSQMKAQFSATFTAGSYAQSIPFTWTYSPTLKGTQLHYPIPTPSVGTDYSYPFSQCIYHASIDKPFDLCGGLVTLRGNFPTTHTLVTAPKRFRFRKVQIIFEKNGVEKVVFTGYISRVRIKPEFGHSDVTLTICNVAGYWQRFTWTPFDVRIFDGMSRNDAADWVLYTEGWGATRRTWHVRGNSIITPGEPTNPAFMLRPDDSKFRTMQDLFKDIEIEIAGTDGGDFIAVPRDYSTGVVHTIKTKLVDVPKPQTGTDVEQDIDFTDSATQAIVTGTDAYGNDLIGIFIDVPAEISIPSGRYSPHRATVQENIPGASTPARIMGRVQDLASEVLPVKQEGFVDVYINPDIGRRDELEVYGIASAGIPDGSRCLVYSVHHEISINPETAVGQEISTAGVRRIT